jgi:hypothetical protein
MKFTLLENGIVAAGGIPTVVAGMLFLCADTQDVSLGRDRSGKSLYS